MKKKKNTVAKKNEEKRFDKMMRTLKPFMKKKRLSIPSTAGRWNTEDQFLHSTLRQQ